MRPGRLGACRTVSTKDMAVIVREKGVTYDLVFLRVPLGLPGLHQILVGALAAWTIGARDPDVRSLIMPGLGMPGLEILGADALHNPDS